MNTTRPVRVLSSPSDTQTSVAGQDILAEFMEENGFTSTSLISFTAKSSIDLIINGDACHMPAEATFVWGPEKECRSIVTVNNGNTFYFWAEF